MGAPDQAIVIALSVGLVESELRNLASEAVPESKKYPNDAIAPGDALSIGIMQQQAGMGYGTVAQIMDPAHAATEFYKRLLATDWQSKDFTTAAADVQRPREDLRGKYGQREAEARDLFTRLQGIAPSGSPGGCAPAGGGTPSSPATPRRSGHRRGRRRGRPLANWLALCVGRRQYQRPHRRRIRLLRTHAVRHRPGHPRRSVVAALHR